MKVSALQPKYVDFIPKILDDGVLYVSRRFSTASHHCACGCGTKIVTPIRETDYRLIERAGLVSLAPSIGNWDHPCQSHYWIRDSKVVWAAAMSKEAISAGRVRDDAGREAYFARVAWPWWRRLGRGWKDWWNSIFG